MSQAEIINQDYQSDRKQTENSSSSPRQVNHGNLQANGKMKNSTGSFNALNKSNSNQNNKQSQLQKQISSNGQNGQNKTLNYINNNLKNLKLVQNDKKVNFSNSVSINNNNKRLNNSNQKIGNSNNNQKPNNRYINNGKIANFNNGNNLAIMKNFKNNNNINNNSNFYENSQNISQSLSTHENLDAASIDSYVSSDYFPSQEQQDEYFQDLNIDFDSKLDTLHQQTMKNLLRNKSFCGNDTNSSIQSFQRSQTYRLNTEGSIYKNNRHNFSQSLLQTSAEKKKRIQLLMKQQKDLSKHAYQLRYSRFLERNKDFEPVERGRIRTVQILASEICMSNQKIMYEVIKNLVEMQ
ncbi:hypothetical protein PPERSA_10682 [Pseudocohnilembus persalinus]|uniref:Uncharacterized protein n=1 Tax=Pseudocohnilembus persalinus TaxID=266149 RepID=A0A0V0QD94_PSEPJ|nr:hypothetical protein PPERSA_10682 [Pseudocohnilembus persalinus]|eukprot:KRX00183.1 hypothetical protein PPERSA_10682 [Pseudocohnilembus persalinus]